MVAFFGLGCGEEFCRGLEDDVPSSLVPLQGNQAYAEKAMDKILFAPYLASHNRRAVSAGEMSSLYI